ncbi:sigma-70 family RNA polymerase sigma factor [Mycolicibacterium neoaurum]|uniref:sigma-70 family RNA polymerase sigma factor n=1 Tax=Mycolicibacterium neoaurum TaxID=1795 RepID=UPI00248CD604|nr:sigma-70 family RNA polymerase sigma factor [Mycolicibacterium neoaurum]WBP93197.1 sigma-70 family RNA polymerase sigma factor [Mycolicibacterium neoaurum]WBS06836.1 sigma-70 family RNA polymerase sigma factor [Mycolicibacterium neoaurum]
MTSAPLDLAALYLRHRDAMYRVAASVLRDRGLEAQAADAVSEAVVSIVASPPENVVNWEAFLVTAAKRKALDIIRSAAVRHAGPELDQDLYDQGDDTDIAEDVASRLDDVEQAAVAWDCLSLLDDRERKVAWEIGALGHSRDEVASRLGVSPSRVSQIFGRAMKMLREEMERKEGGSRGRSGA